MLESVTGPVHTVTYAYEPGRNAMTSVTNTQTAGTPSLVSKYEYTYNELGQRVARAQSGSAVTDSTDAFQYDDLGQVIASTNDVETVSAAWNPTYAFDMIGNRDGNITDLNGTTDYTADLLNQYTQIDTDTPEYDEDGNLTSQGDWTFTWNGENRLIEATDGVNTLTFEYDFQGRLIKKTENSQTEIYLYDGWNRIAAYSGGVVLTDYLWGLDLSGSPQGAGGVGGLLREGSLYPLYDANGNIMQKLDDTGAVQMSVVYDPFGNIIDGTLAGDYGFSTKPLIGELNWYYYGFRYYDPETGRWPNRDPIEERGGVNLYGFVGNDGVNTWDLLGLSRESISIPFQSMRRQPSNRTRNNRRSSVNFELEINCDESSGSATRSGFRYDIHNNMETGTIGFLVISGGVVSRGEEKTWSVKIKDCPDGQNGKIVEVSGEWEMKTSIRVGIGMSSGDVSSDLIEFSLYTYISGKASYNTEVNCCVCPYESNL